MTDLSHLDESGRVKMVDVGEKEPTRRRAVARAVLCVGEPVMAALQAGETPKGNVFAAAHLAGVMAAKRTAELIPLCHPLPLDGITIEFDQQGDRVVITASASTHARTGVEMEALTAAAVAALTLYDMLKAISHEMVIEEVRLLEKSGGRSGVFTSSKGAASAGVGSAGAGAKGAQPPLPMGGKQGAVVAGDQPSQPIPAAVITVSDRCFAGVSQDTSGPAVVELLGRALGARVAWSGIVPDERDQIADKLKELVGGNVHLIVTVGGTGCGPRDVTPEATRMVISREAPGLAEAMRAASAQITDKALLQRGVCGISGASLIVNLPGSPRGALENLRVILPTIPHAVALLQGLEVH